MGSYYLYTLKREHYCCKLSFCCKLTVLTIYHNYSKILNLYRVHSNYLLCPYYLNHCENTLSF